LFRTRKEGNETGVTDMKPVSALEQNKENGGGENLCVLLYDGL
jgi:hypothetical protein